MNGITRILRGHWHILLIFFFALFIRVFQLGSVPSAMHRDELSIAYNAYSILKTGKDEYGVPFPLSFKAFGEYKLPGMIYLTVPSIAMFGLTPFASRLPTAIIGSITVVFVYIFVLELFKRRKIAVFSSLFFAMDYWHIHGSRNIYEPVLQLPLMLLFLFSLLRSQTNKKWLIVAYVSLITSFFSYNSSLVIGIPLAVSGIAYNILLSKKVQAKQILIYLVFVFLIGISSVVMYFAFSGINRSRENSFVFTESSKQEVDEKILFLRSKNTPELRIKMFTNSISQYQFSFLKSYLTAFDPTFLFISGDDNQWHNLEKLQLGNIQLLFFPLIVIGLVAYTRRNTPAGLLLFTILLTSALAHGLTKNTPSINRLFEFATILDVYAGLGMYYLVVHYKKIAMGVLALIFISTALFIHSYFMMYTHLLDGVWLPSFSTAMLDLEEINNKKNHPPMFISKLASGSYISYAFYTQLDPLILQRDAKRNEQTQFTQFLQLNNFFFHEDVDHLFTSPEKIQEHFPQIDSVVYILSQHAPTISSTLSSEIVKTYPNTYHNESWKLYKLTFVPLDISSE
ncbi:MAG: hypothetical protein UX04_C0001G0061 [Microgenomates group bacterium GW2011_GWF2_45_18]|nr:MAG: hypothetical protein UW18_C0003G0170 [Microgenomates group bacterium GW2011_GWF1_44_10]KKU02290.1 MAG: hypothetical protein UX04_C0001G0061 [Microgenomates group bacterium GW2011_GWF2_45_18]OGJ41404.1 MAG: hypothetical protein A2378_00760 [Candidatus Pacebacteria bacterium RIFOXYB1_FULL_44_10]HAU99244.1 hypothetical protein [Candidatus Paceibacterota bacterium]HAX01775.1 hypothetical protein [Candidatus Paceibacterota bacterium]